MELQTLQEALKVEIQVHQKLVAQMKQDPQNADLKKQLHELQAKITALSEKQISDYHQYSHTECDYPSYKYHSPDATVPVCVLLRRRKKKKRLLRGSSESAS